LAMPNQSVFDIETFWTKIFNKRKCLSLSGIYRIMPDKNIVFDETECLRNEYLSKNMF
jgi:hypothetical protein